jgi:AhpD family alkylhydroperoxidase
LGPELAPFHAIAEQMAKAFGYTAQLTIDRQIAELSRLHVAQLMPCSYCLILHTRTAIEFEVHPDKVANLLSWRESQLFSEAEQAALAYCESLTAYNLVTFPAAHQELTKYFDQTEIAELAAVIINMNL